MNLSFDPSLYRRDALEAAAEAYGQLATIAISEEEGRLVAALSEFDPDLREGLVDHFRNHALFETVARVRAEAGG